MLDLVKPKVRFNSKKEYKKELKKNQLKLLQLQRTLHNSKIPMVIVFEGWDAAGKGGVIRRLTERLEPRGFAVHSISAPDDHEKQNHYMRRFWKSFPKKGQLCIFDRSWYGRVLVERIENFATDDDWMRAYDEINATEKMLADDGHIIIKFWLHITKEEQLERFKEREQNPFKHWKLTDEDWRNREKWDDYEIAVNDMVNKTDTPDAKWHIIHGDDKWTARVNVLETIIETIEEHLIKFD
ncbi:polyphosphate kinase 2 family protein [Bacillus sp. FJAT-45350]|uniref:polyphosphate kinase 2 family protein n=1 Tax=Bacillus sp. FJAT-45350 TaxID=2011014 RepID=UPI000BB9069C|nr:UDP-galactose-lipid carrier transferase [Bacillus sp. FJAT-45350]